MGGTHSQIQADPQRGVPDALYTDHGSDSASHRIGRTLNALHVRAIYSAVGRPQSRGGKIEQSSAPI